MKISPICGLPKIEPITNIMNRFRNPLDPDNIQIKTAIQQWVTDRFKLTDSTKIEIIEHACSEPSCVHAETVISIQNTEGGIFYKITKPLVYIRKIDIALMQQMPTKPLTHRH